MSLHPACPVSLVAAATPALVPEVRQPRRRRSQHGAIILPREVSVGTAGTDSGRWRSLLAANGLGTNKDFKGCQKCVDLF